MIEIRRARSDEDFAHVKVLVREFLDHMRSRYPEMQDEIDHYIERKNVVAELSDLRAHFNPPAGECFLALTDGEPVGLCKLKIRPSDGELNRMYVRSSERGAGLGRRLAIAVIEEAQALELPCLYLSALYRHVEAIPLYESLGFQRFVPTDEVQAGDTRVVHMRLVLAD